MDELINRAALEHSHKLWEMWQNHDPLLREPTKYRRLPWSSPGTSAPTNPTPRPQDTEKWLHDEPDEKATQEEDMRGLFKVYIVDPEFDVVSYEGLHIGADDGEAKLRAVMKAVLGKDFSEYDIIVQRLGNVRDKSEIESRALTTLLLDRAGNVERKNPQLKEALDQHEQIAKKLKDR